jgi:hypothetical protein
MLYQVVYPAWDLLSGDRRYSGIRDIRIVSSFLALSLSFQLQKNRMIYFQIFPLDLFEFFQQAANGREGLSHINRVKKGVHDERKAAPRAGVREFSLQG